jgi:hypothetical protein
MKRNITWINVAMVFPASFETRNGPHLGLENNVNQERNQFLYVHTSAQENHTKSRFS